MSKTFLSTLALAAMISMASANGHSYHVSYDRLGCTGTVNALGYITKEVPKDVCKIGMCVLEETGSFRTMCKSESPEALLKMMNPTKTMNDYAIMEHYDAKSCNDTIFAKTYIRMDACSLFLGQFIKITPDNKFLTCTDRFCTKCAEESTQKWSQNVNKCVQVYGKEGGYMYKHPKGSYSSTDSKTSTSSSPTSTKTIDDASQMATETPKPNAGVIDGQVSLMLTGAAALVGTLLM